VAESVANDQKLLTRLEEICHPYVKKELERHFHKAQKAGKASLFVAEVPLLFESNVPFSSWFDTIVTVVGDRQKNKERYIRAGGTAEQFDFRNNRQMSAQEKMQRAHYTLVNNGTVEELKVEAKKLFSIFTNKSP
jgi:dephospho-CoA kinase